LKKGYLKSIDQKVADIFSDRKIKNMDGKKLSMTIEHLLTMTSGISWFADDDQTGDYTRSTDWTQYVLDCPMLYKPGEHFKYNSGAVNLLMSVIRKACGMKTSDFAEKFLFKPIGITDYYWDTDRQGINTGAGGLSLTPMEMARFGYLYLKKGKWNGSEVIPAGWVDASFSKHVDPPLKVREENPPYPWGYGYLWWQITGGYTALGHAGQYIMVLPELDMVVVINSGLSGENMSIPEILFMDGFRNRLFVSDSSLPENSARRSELAAAIRNFENQPGDTGIVMPQKASEISGKKYVLDSNFLNLKTITLNFSSNENVSGEDLRDLVLNVGLDGKYRRTDLQNLQYFARGIWKDDNTLIMDLYMTVFDSCKIKATLKFIGNNLNMTAESSIAEWRFDFTGKME
jgi:hypothetical protein